MKSGVILGVSICSLTTVFDTVPCGFLGYVLKSSDGSILYPAEVFSKYEIFPDFSAFESVDF